MGAGAYQRGRLDGPPLALEPAAHQVVAPSPLTRPPDVRAGTPPGAHPPRAPGAAPRPPGRRCSTLAGRGG